MLTKLRNKAQHGFTLIELMIVVAIIGILAAVAIPAFMKYIKKSKTSEASQFVRKMYEGARAYYLESPDMQFPAGPAQYPDTPAAIPLPAATCCNAGSSQKCTPNPTLWTDPAWVGLKFSVDDPHYFQYSYVRVGTGATEVFSAEAFGDLDCDATLSTFRMIGNIGADGSPSGSSTIQRFNELE